MSIFTISKYFVLIHPAQKSFINRYSSHLIISYSKKLPRTVCETEASKCYATAISFLKDN